MFTQYKHNLIHFVLLFFLLIGSNSWAQTNPIDNSRFISQSIPGRMSPDLTYNLIITFENSGTTTWIPGDYKLHVIPEANTSNSVWSVTDMELAKNVVPGTSVSFEVDVTAPSAEGVYPFTVQLMHWDNAFGQTNKTVNVTVSKGVAYSDVLNSSAFVEQTVPALMSIGKRYKITITMTNTGKTTWTPGYYRLVMLDAAGKAYTGKDWNTYSKEIDEDIAPGGTKVFSFEIIPHFPGVYTLQWRMASSETGLFGDATTPAIIRVEMIPQKKTNLEKEEDDTKNINFRQ